MSAKGGSDDDADVGTDDVVGVDVAGATEAGADLASRLGWLFAADGVPMDPHAATARITTAAHPTDTVRWRNDTWSDRIGTCPNEDVRSSLVFAKRATGSSV